MASVKEISEKLGISPQTVRRYVKSELGVATQPRKMLQLDATQCSLIAAHFAGKMPKSETVVATDSAEVLQEVATLKERVAGLERENELLRERIEVADKALEREQMQARGFWSKLGRKLLGEGDNSV